MNVPLSSMTVACCALFDNWVQIIAEAFVQQSRFDPLHTAETEQALQDNMLEWLSVAASADKVPMQLEYRGIVHQAELESIEWVAAAAPVYQNIVSNLRALFRAEDTPAIQLSDRASRMPGLADTLRNRVGGEVFLLGPGATARGLVAALPSGQKQWWFDTAPASAMGPGAGGCAVRRLGCPGRTANARPVWQPCAQYRAGSARPRGTGRRR